jgi:4-diphosphocytidyl-2C-methyl-D-erythritol kinase
MKDIDKYEVFNYHHMTEDHKLAAEECARLCEKMGNDMGAKLIRNQFSLEELEKKSVDDSVFCKLLTGAGITFAAQGHKRIGETLIPVIAVVEDIDTLDNLAIFIKNINPD